MKIVFTFMEGDLNSSRNISRRGNVIQDTTVWFCGELGGFAEIQWGIIITLDEPEKTKLPYDIHV